MSDEPPDTVEIAGRMFTIEHHRDPYGATVYGCGILPLRYKRADLIRDIERSRGPEWRR